MFERLGEIFSSGEKYESDADCPEILMWFPKQEDFVPPPPVDETFLEKIDRLGAAVKVGRTEMNEILYGECNPEEKVIRSLELKREVEALKKILLDCESNPDAKKPECMEAFAKARAGLMDFQANVNTMDPVKFAADIKHEYEFKSGLSHLLTPWIDKAEKVTSNSLDKPTSFDTAREIEKSCVMFAKDVRKANKLLGKVEETAKKLSSNKCTAEQDIEAQRIRFKKIASIAASRVESMRDLLIRWEEMSRSEGEDNLDLQPLTMFLKCYSIYFT